MQKLLIFFSKNISIFAIFNDKSFKDTLTNDIISFEQLCLGFQRPLGVFNMPFFPCFICDLIWSTCFSEHVSMPEDEFLPL